MNREWKKNEWINEKRIDTDELRVNRKWIIEYIVNEEWMKNEWRVNEEWMKSEWRINKEWMKNEWMKREWMENKWIENEKIDKWLKGWIESWNNV